jgi:hypothetical protein
MAQKPTKVLCPLVDDCPLTIDCNAEYVKFRVNVLATCPMLRWNFDEAKEYGKVR